MTSPIFRLSRHFCTKVETPLKTAKACIQNLHKEPSLTKLVENFKKFSDIPRVRGRHAIYEKTITRLTAAKKFPLIEDLLEHQKKYPEIKKEGFTIRLIYLYGKAGMTDHAHKTFDEMPERECPRTVKSLNALLSAYLQSNKFDDAEKLFRELPVSTSIEPDDRTYNVILQALCEKGELGSAENMLNEMESNGMKLAVFTYNILMNGFYSNGRFEDGERVWDRMVKSGVEPDLVSFNGKLKGLLHEGEISKAVEILEEELGIRELKPDVVTYNILIKWYCNAGRLDEGKELYERMKKNECAPNRAIYQALIVCGCAKDDLDFSLELCKDCVNQHCHIDVAILQTVINLLVKDSRVEEAKELRNLASSMRIYRFKLKMPSTSE